MERSGRGDALAEAGSTSPPIALPIPSRAIPRPVNRDDARWLNDQHGNNPTVHVPFHRSNYADDMRKIYSVEGLSSLAPRYFASALACGISYDMSSSVLMVATKTPGDSSAPRPAEEVRPIWREMGRTSSQWEQHHPPHVDLLVPVDSAHPRQLPQLALTRLVTKKTDKAIGHWFCWSPKGVPTVSSLPARVSLRTRINEAAHALRDQRLPPQVKSRYLLAYIYPSCLYGIENYPRLDFPAFDGAVDLFTAHSLGLPQNASYPAPAARRRFFGLWPVRVFQGYVA